MLYLYSLALCVSVASCAALSAAEVSSPGGNSRKVEQHVWIKASPEKVFGALTEAAELKNWWPKDAASDPKQGGKLTLTWMNGSKMESSFKTFTPGKEVSYAFYTEQLCFKLEAKDDGTTLTIVHECTAEDVLHVAETWGFLRANLKSWLEHKTDLR
jgi:uncharacterized protein YndB with AHSA1/START domain